MSKGKGLGWAAAALLLFGVYQAAGAATAAAQEIPGGMAAARAGLDKTASYERRAEHRGNVYGSHGVIGHTEVKRGYYGAAARRPAHRYYRHGSYGRGYHPGYYAHRYYPARPVVAGGYYGAGGYYSQYYAHRYYPRPAPVDAYYGAAGYYPQYYGRGYYQTEPVGAAAPGSIGSIFAPTNWSASCVNGRICTGYSYYRGVPMCRTWAACNY